MLNYSPTIKNALITYPVIEFLLALNHYIYMNVCIAQSDSYYDTVSISITIFTRIVY